MEEGYLIIATHAEHPGLVRIRKASTPPDEPEPGEQTGERIGYVGRFNDLSAAQMQVHTRLHRRLVDIETGLYRSDAVTAVAAAQSLALRHTQVYLAPEIARDPGLEQAIAKRRWRHRLADRLWQVVGIVAVISLVLKILFGF